MGIILAGDRSGTGKTTLTLALLAALTQQKQRVQPFKIGPDYIDPMFHRTVTGRPCYNLDPVLTSEAYVQRSYHTHSAQADMAVVEGVMGLFDGATGSDDTASTAHIARLLGLPVVLVVDCGRMARSLAALVQGYRHFDSRIEVAGVVLNRVGSDRHLQLLSEALATIEMPILGIFHRETNIELPSRHLGLVPTGEVHEFSQISQRLAQLGNQCFDWNKLTPLLTPSQNRGQAAGEPNIAAIAAPQNAEPTAPPAEPAPTHIKIAVAWDDAFNFYYPDNLAGLEAAGADLIRWSPLADDTLPAADGLYFGGGFPEVFAQGLSENQPLRSAIHQAIGQGMPTYAECGGLMYLSQTLVDFEGRAWPMVGAMPQTLTMGKKLALGYRQAQALQAGLLLPEGQTVVGHEFHKSSILEPLTQPMYETRRYWGEANQPQLEGFYQPHLQASYLHIHWGDRPDIPKRFVAHCQAFARQGSAQTKA